MTTATGPQYALRRGEIEAIVTGVGAGLRVLRRGGVDLIPPYSEHQPRPFASGLILAPWPNRVRDGLWRDPRGDAQQLDLTEPGRGNAIHGLLRFSEFSPETAPGGEGSVPADPARLVLSATIYPQHGYPHLVRVSVEYELTEDGVRSRITAENLGETAAPVALGAHSFLAIGGVPESQLRLYVSCDRHIRADEQLIPVGDHSVAGTEFDLRGGVPVAGLSIDDGFFFSEGAGAAEGERNTHRLEAADGRAVSVWGGPEMRWWQIFTTTEYPGVDRAVAIEPMTAETDALNSERGLVWVPAGGRFSADWGIESEGFGADSR